MILDRKLTIVCVKNAGLRIPCRRRRGVVAGRPEDAGDLHHACVVLDLSHPAQRESKTSLPEPCVGGTFSPLLLPVSLLPLFFCYFLLVFSPASFIFHALLVFSSPTLLCCFAVLLFSLVLRCTKQHSTHSCTHVLQRPRLTF